MSLCSYTEPCDRAAFEDAWRLSLPTAPVTPPTAEERAVIAAAGLSQPPAPGDVWYATAVDFSGPFSGEVAIVLTRSLTLELYRSFAGMNLDENPSEFEIRDFAAEFANVVCGSWLTKHYTQLKFDLAAPSVDVLLPDPSAPAAGYNDFAAHLYLKINDIPVQVTFAPRVQRAAAGM
ncbi:MAG: chemotaxis protein CheX [Candidatus Eisenbacteria bacterium]